MTSVASENGKKVLTMAEYFAGGHLRFVDGEWRDNDGNAIEISRVRHGRWTPLRINGHEIGVTCSGCNTTWDAESNRCPNCGARMDGEANEKD